MKKKYSLELRDILDRKISKCAGDLDLDPGHTKVLLYAILKHRSRVLDEALLYMNVNVDELLEEITSIETPELVVIDPKITKVQNSYHEIHINNLLINAERESKVMNHDEVGPEHVLLACLKYKGENKNILELKSIMQKYGIKPKDYVDSLIWLSSEEEEREEVSKETKKSNNSSKSYTGPDEETDPQVRANKIERNLIGQGHIRNMNNIILSSPEIFIGRENEIDRSVRVLCRRQKRNLMIIGESGTGKTSLVKGIVEKIVSSSVPEKLLGKTCYQVYLDNIVAGTKFRGEFEKKLKDIIDFLALKNSLSDSLPILFIDEIHTLVGAGAAEGSLDASGIIKPRLSSGEIQCIGTTTIEEYRKRILPDTALCRRFTNIFLEEPNEKETIGIMKGLRAEFEEFHGVSISDYVIAEIVDLSGRYVKNRFFPDKAIDVLDEACVKTVSSYQKKDRDFEYDDYGNVMIPQDMIGEIMTDFTRVPLSVMVGDEKKKLSCLGNKIKTNVVGQDDAVDKVVQSIYSSRAGFTDPEKPISTFLFLGSTGVGKCHGKGTEILRYDGTVEKVENLKAGDMLMGPDSSPRKITSLARGRDKMYRVVPNKGDSFTCNGSHILRLVHTSTGKEINISIDDYLLKNKTFKHTHKLYRVGVDFEKKEDLKIDPYFVGLWLGDGSSHCAEICTEEIEIADYIYNFASKNGLKVNKREQKNNNSSMYRIVEGNGSKGSTCKNHLYKEMKKVNLFKKCGDSDFEKFIPEQFLLSSFSDRLKLLAGLIDSDGSLCNNCYDFVSKYKRLCEQVSFLSRSLGFSSDVVEKKIEGKKYYRTCISGETNIIPVLIERKKSNPRKTKKNNLRSGFSIEEIGVDDYYGFTLDNDDGLYLLGDFTVTHNTHLAKTLSNELFGTEKIIRLDMSEYMEKNSVARLVGSPPGYVGYEEAGQLTEAVRNKPYSVILLDEIEKAHPSVFNLFLQVFDEGRLTDSTGRYIDFRNTIIIMTSNIGVAGIKAGGKKIGFSVPKEINDHEEVEEYLINKVKDFFAPEFVNRIDDIIVFKKISKENSHDILAIEIAKTRERVKARGYKMVVTASAKDFLVEEGFDEIYGARPIRRLIKKLIEQPLATMVVNGDLTKGDAVYISNSDDSPTLNFTVKNQ